MLMGMDNIIHQVQIHSNRTSTTHPIPESLKTAPSANLSHFVPNPSSGAPNRPPELAITETSSQHEYSSDEISYLGVGVSLSMLKRNPLGR